MTTPDIPGLRFTALLIQGNTFTTWKAEKTSLQRDVDVKILQEGTASDLAEHSLAMFRALAKLTHPGLAQIYDVVAGGGITHVVMEHIEGASLAGMVAGTGRLNTPQALRLALQLAEALDYTWTQARIVFRSLKPQNLRVNGQGILKISEFGLAIQVKAGENPIAIDHGDVVGTPHYISPEQATLNPAIDFCSDMYALGAILYFLVTAKSPFEGLDTYEILKQQVSGQIPHPRNVNSQLTMPVCQLIMRLMMKQPGERYATWSDAIQDMRLLLANRAPAGRLPNGLSTIAPYAGQAGHARLGTTAGSAPRTTADRAPRARKSGGGPFILWLLLMLWFAWLANERLDNPLGLPSWLVFTIRLPEISRLAAPAATGESQPVTATPPTEAPPPWITPAAGSPAADPTEATPADPSPPPAPSVQPGDPLLAQAALLLGTGDVAGAIAKLDTLAKTAPHAAGSLTAIGTALKSLPSPLRAVEAGFLAKRGQELVIRFQGRDRRIMPRAVVAGNLQAEFLADDGTSRPVTFPLDKLDAAEQLRWILEPRTPADHAIVCILALRADDAERFRAHRGQTGALSPLFAALNP
jgi:hypothetical protein